jgi:amino acid transporter
MKATSGTDDQRITPVAIRKAVGFLGGAGDVPEGFWYNVKLRLLGPPLVNEQLQVERLSKPLGLGVLSCDGISSANYGSELMLVILLPFFGMAAFTLLLPMTLVILLGITLVVLSYREVVSVYTRAGGSYVVARENFGPRVAQIAAVALMVDYVVTVAVQTAAGSQAILSTFPALAHPLGGPATLRIIAVTATLVMAFVNMRGVRENGKTFALPTYLFSASVGLMILVGLYREVFGGGLPLATWGAGHVAPENHANGLLAFGAIYILAKAYANGGSSLTGIEAVSNAVSALRPPEGRNARELLVIQGSIVAFLIAGISWLAHITHAIPYGDGFPTVLSQEAQLVFGSSIAGLILFYVLQAGAISILFTGGNTSFSGFPFLTSFVAEDSFLPRWLSKRGHRLVFSNGIVVLTVLALALLLVVGANTNNLVPFYAIGVFTGFSMAGFGMVRYHTRTKESGWRRRRVINFVAGVYTALVVVIFAIVKFTAGAWLVVVVFPIGVYAFIRLNQEYRTEANVLERIGGRPRPAAPPNYPRRTVYLLVDSFDLATLAALRYARSLRPTTLRAVHFVIDTAQADQLREEWMRADRGVVLDFIDVPDRRLTRAAADLVSREAALPGTHVTVVLPRRSYSPLLGRLLHDRTADKIANVVSRIPHSAATIVPFDVRSRLEDIHKRQQLAQAGTGTAAPPAAASGTGETAVPATAAAGSPPSAAAQPVSDGLGGAIPATGPAGAVPLAPGTPVPVAADDPAVAAAAAGASGDGPAAAIPVAAAGDRQARSPAGDTAPPATAGDTGPKPPAAPALSPLRSLLRGRRGQRGAAGPAPAPGRSRASYDRPAPSPGVNPIGSLTQPGRATVEGRVRAVEIRPVERNSVLAVEISDATGDLTALFYGRSHIPGIICGAKARFRGPVGIREGSPVMVNPAYELLAPGSTPPPAGQES